MTHSSVLWTSFGAAIVASALTVGSQRLLESDPPKADHEQIDRISQVVADSAESQVELRGRLRELSDRLAGVEAIQARTPVPVPTTEAKPQDAAAVPATVKQGMAPKRFRALMTKLMRSSMEGEASEEEQEEFWAAARTGTTLSDHLAELQNAVEQNPNDANLRIELADAYVAKLLTVPIGPERGVWGMKAEREWKEALDIDSEHWDAQYSIAFSHSMYPDFLNKTDDAILGFERALEIQKAKPHDPRHAKTYVGLVRMYKKKGRTDDAIKVMKEAVSLHPDNTELAATLQELQDEKRRAAKK